MPYLPAPRRSLCGASTILLALAGSSGIVCASPQEDPWATLRRVYAEPFGVDAFCIQRRVPMDGKGVLLVHIAVNRKVGITSKVLEPTSMSDYVMVDDGQRMRNYDPDTELVWEQPSPNLYRPEVDRRIEWARRNYVAKSGGTAKVGNRVGVVVRLVPRQTGMPERRLTVDPDENMLLRSERLDGDGWVKTVDTLLVVYGKAHGRSLSYPPGAKVKKSWGPRQTTEYSRPELKTLLGFTPVVPAVLPRGFQTIAKHVVGGAEHPFAAMRVTDGIANATVYAWAPSRHPSKHPVSYPPTAESDSGVRFAATGDVPTQVLRELAESFARALGGNGELAGPSVPLPPIAAPIQRGIVIPPLEPHEQAD